ncbi:CHRD domain-containing protein [Candidatus Microgenomates bacterium]|nr:CHRD domain-containing protein [Candidatus Microgenomates bacterium]
MRVKAANIIGVFFLFFLILASSVFFFNTLPKVGTQAAVDDQKLIISKTIIPDGNAMPSLADQIGNLPSNWNAPNYYTGDTIAKFVVTGKPTAREFTINICMWFSSFTQEHCSNTWNLVSDGTYYIKLNPSALWWTKSPDTWQPNQTPNDMGLVVTDTLTDKLAYYGCGDACFGDPSVNIRAHLNFSIKSEVYLVKDGALFVKPSTWADCPTSVCTNEPMGIKASNLPAGASGQVALASDGTLSINPAAQKLDGYAPNKLMFNHDTDAGGYFNTCDNVTLTTTKAQYAHHFKVPKKGVFNIWFRMYAPSETADSFRFFGYTQNGEFRATCNQAWGNGKFPTGQWQWVSHTNGLPGGGFAVYLQPNADLYFVYEESEPGVKLDYMLLTTDLACKPGGENGDGCVDSYRYSIHKTLGVGPPITDPPLSVSPSQVPSPSVSPSPTPDASCDLKPTGDADCNGKVSLADYSIWRSEFQGATTKKSDFSGDGKVSLADFSIWRSTFVKNPGISPGVSPTIPQPTNTPSAAGRLYIAHLVAPQGVTSSASGNGSLSISADGKSAVVTLTSTLDAGGQITAEHIHGPGALPDQFDVQLFPLIPGTQTINLSTMTAGQMNDLKTGKWYFNIHTFTYTGGEIRGTLVPEAAP